MRLLANDKGFAMPLALILGLVVMLLGTALWHYSMTDTRQTALHNDQMQAHYSSRSGALIGLKKIQQVTNTNALQTTANVFSSLGSTKFTGNIDGNDFNVEYEMQGDNILITSTGEGQDYKNTTTLDIDLRLFPYSRTNTVLNPDNWLTSSNSHNLHHTASNTKYENDLVTLNQPNQAIKYTQTKENIPLTLLAKGIYFGSDGEPVSLEVDGTSVTLDAMYVHFYGGVEVNSKSNHKAKLFLQLTGENPDRKFSAQAVKSVVKSVPHNTLISNYYGLVYFAGNIMYDSGERNSSPQPVPNTSKGFYLFPAGQVIQFHPTNNTNLLIRISDSEGLLLRNLVTEDYRLLVNNYVWGRD